MDSVVAYAQYCVGSRFDAPVCAPFWTWVVGGFFSAAFVIIFFLSRRIYLDGRRRRAADVEEARRRRTDLDAIAAARWQGDALAGDPENHPALAEAIRSHVRTVTEANRTPSSLIIVPGDMRRP